MPIRLSATTNTGVSNTVVSDVEPRSRRPGARGSRGTAGAAWTRDVGTGVLTLEPVAPGQGAAGGTTGVSA